MSRKAFYVRHQAKPGKRDEVKRIWEKYARAYVEDMQGQIYYVYGYDDTDPNVIIAYQLSDGEAGTDDFVKQPWFADYQRETAALLAAPTELRSITPQWVKGAAA